MGVCVITVQQTCMGLVSANQALKNLISIRNAKRPFSLLWQSTGYGASCLTAHRQDGIDVTGVPLEGLDKSRRRVVV